MAQKFGGPIIIGPFGPNLSLKKYLRWAISIHLRYFSILNFGPIGPKIMVLRHHYAILNKLTKKVDRPIKH